MRLELFNFIEHTISLLEMNQPSYQYVQGVLRTVFQDILLSKNDILVGLNSRIKAKDSLKEKLIRNKYYLNFETAQDAIDNLPDLIGITLNCRFISDEIVVFNEIYAHFQQIDGKYYQCNENKDIYLNLKMPQPQLQRNGFTIYRIDGYMNFNHHKINFELQIKSLVHSFWSEVEHQVVYKNTQFVVYDGFVRNILGTIRDNLDVVDRQLQVVHRQLGTQNTNEREIGMTETGFKLFIAKAINDLVAMKMSETVGFTTDFKKCSSILSQYIYIKDFVTSENPQFKMVEYFEHFNFLQITDLDFTCPIYLEKEFIHHDPFCNVIGQYWQDIINVDYEWHVFFVMLFAIQPGNNIQDFTQFIEIIKNLIVTPSWYSKCFSNYGESKGKDTRDYLLETLAHAMVNVGKVEIVHEDKLFNILETFRDFIELLQSKFKSFEEFDEMREDIKENLNHKISNLF